MPTSTNPGSMEAGEYRLTRETCFVVRHLENGRDRRAAVYFLVRRDFFFFVSVALFERTRPAARMKLPCLIYLSTSNCNEAVSCL